jgi:hypothetical protein
VGDSLACAEFGGRAALAAVDSRGVELGDDGVVATVFRSKSEGFKTLEEARESFGFNRPAVLVESSEGDHRENFQWTQKIERDLIERLQAALGCAEPIRVTTKQDVDSGPDGSSPHPITSL